MNQSDLDRVDQLEDKLDQVIELLSVLVENTKKPAPIVVNPQPLFPQYPQPIQVGDVPPGPKPYWQPVPPTWVTTTTNTNEPFLENWPEEDS